MCNVVLDILSLFLVPYKNIFLKTDMKLLHREKVVYKRHFSRSILSRKTTIPDSNVLKTIT